MACIYKINGKTFNTTEEIQNYVSSDEFVSVLAKGNLGISKEIRNLILNKDEKTTNEVREIEDGQREKGNEGKQSKGKNDGQKTNDVQNEEVTEGGVKAPQVKTIKNQIADLRAAEQAEYDAMSNPKDKAKREEIYNRYDKLITPLLEQEKAGSVGAGGENPALKDVESTAKALDLVDKLKLSELEKLSGIYYHGNSSKKIIDQLKDMGNGIHVGTKEQAKDLLNLQGTEGTLYKVKLSAKEIIEGVDEEDSSNISQKDVDGLVRKYMADGYDYMTSFNKAIKELREPFLYKNQIGKADALKYINKKEGSSPDYSIVTFNPNFTEIISAVSYDKNGKIIIFDRTKKSISEAYHKAKADGSNPELVKAVEDVLAKAPTQYTEAATPQAETSKPKPENVKAIEEAMTKKSGTIKNEIIKEAADPTEVKKILDNLDSIKSKLAGLTTKDGDSVFSEECKWG